MKKALIISYHYGFSDSTGALRPRAMMKYLPVCGWDTAVLTFNDCASDVQYDGDIIRVRDLTKKNSSWVRYYGWRIWQKSFRKLGVYRATQGYWRDTALLHADEIIAYVKPDLILATYPSIEALEIGLALSERYDVPLVSDFRDGMLFEPVESKALQLSCVDRYYRNIEKKVVQMSRMLLTVSSPISEYFRSSYHHPSVKTLYNGFDPDDMDLPSNEDVVLSNDVVNIVHTGRLSGSREGTNCDGLLGALVLLQDRFPSILRKLKIHFVGLLTECEISAFADFVALGVVVLWGHQPRARALEFQKKADVLLLITAPGKKSVVTGKIFEYIMAKKMILALAKGTEAAVVVEESGLGQVVSQTSACDIAEAIKEIVLDTAYKVMPQSECNIFQFSRVEQMKDLALALSGMVDHES